MEKRLLIFMLLFVNTFLMSAGFVTNGSYVSGTADIASQIVSGIIGLLFIILILGYFLKTSRRKTSNGEFSKFRVRLQPGKNDLMINNQWGVSLTELDENEAGRRGLIKWNHRWVTKEELLILKPQYRAYRGIRWITIIIYCLGTWALIRAFKRFQSFPTDIRDTVEFLSLFLYPVFHVVVGYNLQRFKNWARWVAVILFPLLIPPRYLYAYQTNEIFQWRLFVALFFVFILVTVFSKTGRIIFSSKRVAVSLKDSMQHQAVQHNNTSKTPQPILSLIQAVNTGDTQKVAQSISHSPTIDERDDQGRTPLIIASDKGHKEIVELPVTKGVKRPEVSQSSGENLEAGLAYLNSESFLQEIDNAKRARDQASAAEWKLKGSPGLGQTHSCCMCYNTTYGEETVIRLQNGALALNNIFEAHRIEERSGYRCKSCGKEYCKDCLEKKAPGNVYGGKSCPSCNGLFEIIHG